jgi:hypothetical protein
MGFIIGAITTLSLTALAVEMEMISVSRNTINLEVNTIPIAEDNFIYQGRTYVQLRAIGEMLGKKIGWDNLTRTATIDDCKIIEVDGGDLSGHREPNVMVDIGFGDRKYWAFTNEHGQLVRVVADEITLQDESSEPVLSNGRYYSDEAKVSGTESPTLDQGHVLADSLGGVANAYNITPQDSTLNRHGDQAYMEKVIRDAGGCTNFEAIITYPNTTTQIPSHYKYSYTIMGNEVVDEFDNVNPEPVPTPAITIDVSIKSVSLKGELVYIKNNTNQNVNLNGWKLVSVTGNQTFTFGSNHNLAPYQEISIASGRAKGDIKWTGAYIWNNDGDKAELYDNNSNLIDTK